MSTMQVFSMFACLFFENVKFDFFCATFSALSKCVKNIRVPYRELEISCST